MPAKIEIFLWLTIFCVVALSEQTEVFGAVGTITIEREGITPTTEELKAARNAVPIPYTALHTTSSTVSAGFRANPVVNASAAVMAYHEGRHPPYPFRMFFPKEVRSGETYPLVLWLHGAGERRNDNESQLAFMEASIDILAGPNRPDFYLVAVQCSPEAHSWGRPDPRSPHGETVLEMVDKIVQALIEDYPIDIDRISILGISFGASAGFNLIKMFPNRFSALAVCSSGGSYRPPDIYRYQPIWIFNNRDDLVDVDYNLFFANWVNNIGGNVYVTVHERGGHNTWTRAQRDYRIMEWLLRQRRGRFAFPQNVPMLDRSETNVFLVFILPFFILVTALALPRKIRKKG
ncbi:MAG: hypothetical protein ACOX6D_03815 [Thermoguttaceae bacterium]